SGFPKPWATWWVPACLPCPWACAAKAAAELFNENSRLAAHVPATAEMSELNGELTTLKGEIIADIALGSITVEEGYARFENEGGLESSDIIVESLNALNK
ncbi:MAG: hypothetical protein J6Y48_04625, partial [Clostridia bacterium]|nr:hypothetical protein [Clostridia bacterium]